MQVLYFLIKQGEYFAKSDHLPVLKTCKYCLERIKRRSLKGSKEEKKRKLLFGNFPCQIRIHPATDFRLAKSVPKQEHEFGNSAFGRTVVAADNAGFEQMQSGFVASHLNTAALALGNVDNDDASFCCVLQLPDEPVLLRCIAGTECLENHCFPEREVQNR